MRINNITVTRAPVKSFDELGVCYRRLKFLTGENNLREVTSREKLMEEGFYKLEAAYDYEPTNIRIRDDDSNKKIIEEIGRFAAKYPNFQMNAKMTEEIQDEMDEFEKVVFTIKVQNGEVDVVLI